MDYDSTGLVRDARCIAPSLWGVRVCWKRGGMTIDTTFCRGQYQLLGAAFAARLKPSVPNLSQQLLHGAKVASFELHSVKPFDGTVIRTRLSLAWCAMALADGAAAIERE
jgi:hypothetical protein